MEVVWFIGTGFIGWNMAQNFKERWFDVIQYSLSPKYNWNKEALSQCDKVFVAVPTPTKNRKFDDSILLSAIKEATYPWQKIIIKSTIICWTTEKLQKIYPDRYFFHSAEFLTEKNAKKDVDKPSRNIVWYTELSKPYAQWIMDILPKSKHNILCSATESEMWKYMSNFLLTSKLIMANLFWELCKKYNISYDMVSWIAGKDKRIWNSHLQVEDKNKCRWANGHCFPKDMATVHEMYGNYSKCWHNLLEGLEIYNLNINLRTKKQIEIITKVFWLE